SGATLLSRIVGMGRRHAAGLALLAAVAAPSPASAASDVTAWLLFDAQNGEVLARENAFQAWQPASVTKLMTTYVVLKALQGGR
ncbi:hypothetical protein J8J40_31955, partial [Mycobacterium tuberculosis]|nr:hypothetical protein [Mycobacterium tuberculosis]